MDTFLTREQFGDAIRKGLGRALLHLKHHKVEPYLDEVIYACTHNTIYDRQCEDSRERYLLRAIAMTGWDSRIRQAIMAALLSEREYSHLDQLFLLACGYANRGDPDARRLMYEKFDRNDATVPFIGACVLIDMDDIAGLLYAARKVGQEVMRGAAKGDVYLVENARDVLDEKRAREVLAKEALQDPAIKAYLDAVMADDLASRSILESGDRRGRPFAELLAEVEACQDGMPSIQWRSWARAATSEDLLQLALLIERETRHDRLFGYLSAFMRRTPYPLAPDKLVELTSSENQELAYRAVIVLREMRHPRVRRHFFELLSSRRHLRIVFGLLKQNFVSGDEQFILRWLGENTATDLPADDVHGIGLDLLNVFEVNEESDVKGPMTWVYQSTPCSLCRSGAFKLLVNRNAASHELLEECRHDCCEGTRKLALQTLRTRRQNRLKSTP